MAGGFSGAKPVVEFKCFRLGDSVFVWSQSETAREVNEMIGEIQSRWMMVDWKVATTLRWSKSQGGAGEHAYLFISKPGQPVVLVNVKFLTTVDPTYENVL